MDLSGWQEYYGLAEHSTQAELEVEFCPETLELNWRATGDVPACVRVDALHQTEAPPTPIT